MVQLAKTERSMFMRSMRPQSSSCAHALSHAWPHLVLGEQGLEVAKHLLAALQSRVAFLRDRITLLQRRVALVPQLLRRAVQVLPVRLHALRVLRRLHGSGPLT